MESELEQVRRAACELGQSVGGRDPRLAGRALRLTERLADGRFHVSVLGEFKRGKSTLINAIVGDSVLPTGALPLTAVTTEVRFGARAAEVVHMGGERRQVGLDELADYVTEARNPGNERAVDRVEIFMPIPVLEPGLVLVDTPGLGSIHRHNDAAARQALLDADGAILVLSADTPLSEQERELLATLAERHAPTFFVLNKVDHLGPDELDQVRRFVTDTVADELGRKERIWCVAALPALRAATDGQDESGDSFEFKGFLNAIGSFVEADLLGTRLATAKRELGRLATELIDSMTLASSAMAFEAGTLARKVQEFRAAGDRVRRAFADDRLLLARDVARLGQEIGDRLWEFAHGAPTQWEDQLAELAATARVSQLEDELRALVERAVHESFDVFREQEADRADQGWQEIAGAFRIKAQERVNAIRAVAADIFDADLPELTVPEVSEERQRFFYLFLHVGRPGEGLGRAARRLLPSKVVRRRQLAVAQRHLYEEFDKHAGRARWDLVQRLEAVRLRFEVAMREELNRTVEAILAAADRAERLRRESQAERGRRSDEEEAMRRAAFAALAAGGEAP